MTTAADATHEKRTRLRRGPSGIGAVPDSLPWPIASMVSVTAPVGR